MRRSFILLLLSIVAVPSFYAQSFTALDGAGFMRGDSVQLETYYSILQRTLNFKQEGNAWVAPINGSIQVFQDGKEVRRMDIHKTKSFTGSKDDLSKHIADDIIDGAFFAVASSQKVSTEISLVLTGLGDDKQTYSDTIRKHIVVPWRDKTKYQFCGVEFASSVEKTSDPNGFFEKVGFNVIPNPSRVYGGNFTKLYYYTEILPPAGSASPTNKGQLQVKVIDGQQHEMYKAPVQELVFDHDVNPIIGTVEVEGLPTDSYYLDLVVMREGQPEAHFTAQFYYDSGIQMSDEESSPAETSAMSEDALFRTSDFGSMPELELEEHATQSFFGAPELTKKQYKALSSLDAKRRFLFDYWRAKDKEVQNAVPLALYRAMLKRVEYANRTFSVMKKPGWKTHRGRVYIQYGAPDVFDNELFNTDSRPYITWTYTSQKIPLSAGSQAEFDFVDEQGGGDFQLVNSNVRGETYDPNWFTNYAQRTSQ